MPAPKAPVRPPSFWEKVVAFFTRRRPRRAPQPGGTNTGRAPRKPEHVEVTSPKLYVGNLSFSATEDDLFDLFRGAGSVKHAEVVCHQYSERSKGFAFVTMSTIGEARRAVEELHDQEFMGRRLVVTGAKSGELRRSDGRNVL